MCCPACNATEHQRSHGRSPSGVPRYHCMVCGRTYTDNSRALADKKRVAGEIFLANNSLLEVCSELGITKKAAIGLLRGTIEEVVRRRVSATKRVSIVVQETGVPLSVIKKIDGIDAAYFSDPIPPEQLQLLDESFYTDSPTCPHCNKNVDQIKRGFTRANRQRYFCKGCRRTYTPKGRRPRYSEMVKRSSVMKYRREKRLGTVSKEMGVSQPALARWDQGYAKTDSDPTYQNMSEYRKINRTKSKKKP